MARGRGGASTGFAIALVIVSIFFVASLVVAILLATERTELKDARRIADNNLAKYVTPGLQKDSQVLNRLDQVDSANKTVVQQLLDEKAALVSIITGGGESDTPETIWLKLEEIGIEKGNTLITAYQDVTANYNKSKADAATVKDSLKAEQAKVLEGLDANASKATEYDQQVTALGEQLTAVQATHTEFQTKAKARFQELEQQLVTARQELADTQSNDQIKIDQLKKEIIGVKNQLKRRPKVSKGSFDYMPASRHADGKVVKVDSIGKLVYIDRGRSNRMILGLAFVVFDKRKGVTPDRNGQYEGKAILEVISIDENSSTCRIVEMNRRGLKISSDDIVANAAWDPNMTFKFYVHGEFDIDRVGKAQEQDRQRIASICRKFGGSVTIHRAAQNDEEATRLQRNELTKLLVGASKQLEEGTFAETIDLLENRMEGIKRAQTQGTFVALAPDLDFLVLGQEPKVGAKPAAGEAVEKHEEWKRAMLAYQTYKALEQEARDLAIPILNQNRFLQLVGYYRR
jgi:hypothetical protein